jgi:hypothetical protein
MPITDSILDNKRYKSGWEDNGGRRKIRDRRFFPPIPRGPEKRNNLKQRAGFDRRIRDGGVNGFEFRKSLSVNF